MQISKPISYAVWSGRILPEINLQLHSVEIRGETRRFRAAWNRVIQFEAEMASMLTNEIAQELNRYIIDALVTFSQSSAVFLPTSTTPPKPKPFVFPNRQ